MMPFFIIKVLVCQPRININCCAGYCMPDARNASMTVTNNFNVPRGGMLVHWLNAR